MSRWAVLISHSAASAANCSTWGTGHRRNTSSPHRRNRSNPIRTRMSKLADVLSTWFGCGYAPVAPGTAGSAGAIAVAIVLARYAGFAPWQFALLAVLLFAPAVWAAGETARALGKKDPGI